MKPLAKSRGIVLPFTGMNAHETTALESLRQINKELLVISMTDINPATEKAVDAARDHVLAAIQAIEPRLAGQPVPPEELPVAQFKAQTQANAKKFSHLTQPTTDLINRNDPTRN